MLARGQGYIVNIDSPGAWLPWPGATGYLCGALGDARIHRRRCGLDLHGTGIRVLEVVPGKVDQHLFRAQSAFGGADPAPDQLVPTLTPEQVATALVRGIERDRRKIVHAGNVAARMLMARALAPALVDWLMWRTGARRPRIDHGSGEHVPRLSDPLERSGLHPRRPLHRRFRA